MKKLAILLAFIKLNAVSQVHSSGTLQIVNVYPQITPTASLIYTCTGDTLITKFKFKSTGQDSLMPAWNLKFVLADNSTVPIKTFSVKDFLTLPKEIVALDTFYFFKYRIPVNFNSMGPGGDIVIQFNLFNIKYPGLAINIQKCLKTGIYEFSQDPTQSIYTDLNGRMVTDFTSRKGEILVEQKGTQRRKFMVQ